MIGAHDLWFDKALDAGIGVFVIGVVLPHCAQILQVTASVPAGTPGV